MVARQRACVPAVSIWCCPFGNGCVTAADREKAPPEPPTLVGCLRGKMPDDDDAIDLRGVLDINRIEAILRGISTRLSAQEAQLAAVVARADEHDTEQLQRVRAALDRALDSVDNRLAAFEARLQRQEAMQPRLTAIERHLDRVNHDLASKPEAEDCKAPALNDAPSVLTMRVQMSRRVRRFGLTWRHYQHQ